MLLVTHTLRRTQLDYFHHLVVFGEKCLRDSGLDKHNGHGIIEVNFMGKGKRFFRLYCMNFENNAGAGQVDCTQFGPKVSLIDAVRAEVKHLVK